MTTVSSEHSPDKQKILDYLARRKQAYIAVFMRGDPDVELLLTDLAKFCRAGESTFNPDPRLDAMLTGRKEVWLRIANHLNLTEDELYSVFVLGKQPVMEG